MKVTTAELLKRKNMGNYHNDQPITGSDTNPDRLNRETFASNLAKILTIDPSDDCLTVSLEGEWGYGKTSVVNLVKKAITIQQNKPVIIEYNPWLAGKAEALIQDFLVQFSSQLNIPDRPKEGLKAAKELLAYSKLFNAMKFIPGVEPWASTVQGVFKVVGSATQKISKLKKLDLIGRKNKIKQILASLNQSIIVIIDDIDRLIPDDVYQIVRLIKAVADFPGTSFLLCFDPEYLAGALEKHGIKKSDQYVDKVVQLRVPLPLITYGDMQRLADIELANLSDKSLTDHFEKDQERLSLLYHQFIKYLIRTPRELKRIFNNLRFVLTQTEGVVSFTDLFCLSVISIKAQHIYQSLKDSPEMYVGRSFDERYFLEKAEDVVKNNKEKVDRLLGQCLSRDKHFIEGLVKELFPLLGDSGYSTYGNEYDRSGRVASEKRLYIALHYQVPTGFAADTDIRNYINGNIDREEYLCRAIKDNFVERFFDLITQNMDNIQNSQIYEILNSLYNIFLHSEYLASFENAVHGFFEFEPFRNIIWITNKLVEKTEDKLSLIENLIQVPKYLPVTADILRRLMIQHGDLKSDDPRLKEEKWVEAEHYSQIKENWSQVAIRELLEGNLLDSVHASHVYFVLYRASEKGVSRLFATWLNQDHGVEKIAKLVGRCGSDSTNGPYSQIDQSMMSNLLDFQKLKELVDSELSSGKELTNYLKAVYLSISTGEKYYLNNAKRGERF
jgi:predicted KAP-like P-loop ATPase